MESATVPQTNNRYFPAAYLLWGLTEMGQNWWQLQGGPVPRIHNPIAYLGLFAILSLNLTGSFSLRHRYLYPLAIAVESALQLAARFNSYGVDWLTLLTLTNLLIASAFGWRSLATKLDK